MIALLDAVFLLALAAPGGGEGARTARTGLDPERDGAADLELRVGDRIDLPSADEDEEESAEKPKQQDDKQERPVPTEPKRTEEGSGIVDLDWLELQPRIGMAMFSKDYHINPSACFGVEARAPIPWIAPASNPTGDYFGVWAELTGAVVTRTLTPKVAKPSGLILMLGVGADYTILRNETWLLLVRAGIQYATYNGITDLNDGMAPVIGLTAGVSVTRSLSITLAPEYVMGKGDSIILGMVGVAIQF